MVNRLWQWTFGDGLVATPNDFGRKGQAPTHPELLDWLAAEFVERGWSVKRILRAMLVSEAFQLAAEDDAGNRERDPENHFLWRARTPRLDAETLRDSMLAASGDVDLRVGGPAVHPHIDSALLQRSSLRTWPGLTDDDPATWRRSLYVFSKRSIRYPMFDAFDAPDMVSSCARRTVSVTAPQALLSMNNRAVRLQAERFAGRLRRECGPDLRTQVQRGFEIALARLPNEREFSSSVEFAGTGADGLADFCLALFNANEFVFAP
ncbi:MAG: DUF1553 domain-containing protein [Bryobacteraceae bacterium]